MTPTRRLILCLLVLALALPAAAQQSEPADLWRMVPPNALFVAGFDMRPSNATMQTILNVQTQETRDMLAKQQADLRKSAEDLALLFGISLDWAKDIQAWSDQQWALVLLPDGKDKMQPAMLVASKDANAARAAVGKLLEPWQRLGEVANVSSGDFSISSFKMPKEKIEVYVAASGAVVAASTSEAALLQVLKGGGFAAGSAGDKVLNAVSGSMFYAYMDRSMLNACGLKPDMIPVSGFGLGASVTDTGVRLKVLGMPTDEGAKILSAFLLPSAGAAEGAPQPPALIANPAMPSTSLLEATLPNLAAFAGMAGMMGMARGPVFTVAQEIGDTRISGALTAALPIPAGFVSAMAASEQAATEKLAKIAGSLREAKLTLVDAGSVAGVKASKILVKHGPTMYLAQIGQHIILASDLQSFGAAAATIKGAQPALADSTTYKETMAGLEKSNLLTLYANLAPIQGIGYLAAGLGVEPVPIYGAAAKALQNMQALGVGAGFDGQALSATLFLRAKPEIGPTLGPAIVGASAVGAAVLFPVFARARDAARAAECLNNIKELAVAAQMYASDHDGKLPTAAKWRSELESYLSEPLKKLECPCGDAVFAFNKNLSGVNLNKIKNPQSTVLFFEANPDLPNRTGSRADAIFPHRDGGAFAFVDTHAKRMYEAPAQSQWVVAQPAPVKKAPVKKNPAPLSRRK